MKFGEGIITILTAVVGVAVIAVLVSKQANTSGVLSAGGSAFAKIVGAAVAPVSGGSVSGLGNNFSPLGF